MLSTRVSPSGLSLRSRAKPHAAVLTTRAARPVPTSRLRAVQDDVKDDDEEWCTLAGDEDLDECRAVSTPKGVMRVQASVEGFGSEAKFPAAPGVATA